MAKVKLSPFSTALSGKLSNLTFSQTKEGTIMRERITPSNPKTAAQQAVRAAFTKATKRWSALTPAQAEAWNNFAKTYENTQETTEQEYFSSGFNAFVKLAAKWYAVNGSGNAPSLPPTQKFDGDSLTFTVAAQSGGIKVTASAANSAGVVTGLLFAKLSGPNGKAQPGAYRTKAYFAFTSGALATTVALPPGTYSVAVEYVNTATGQESLRTVVGTAGPVTYTVSNTETGSKKKAA